MDAVEYEKARVRMCNTSIREVGSCAACQLYDGLKRKCRVIESIRCPVDEDYCRRTVSIVEQWAKCHPVKTRKSEFLKIFPHANMYNVESTFCIAHFDKTKACELSTPSDEMCEKCRCKYWNEEISE